MAEATSNNRRRSAITENVVAASALPSPIPTKFTTGYLLIPFGWAAEQLTAMLAANPTLHSDLLMVDYPRMHVIAMALAHLNGQLSAEIGAILFRAPIRQVLLQVLGRSVPGIKGVLRQLPSSVLSRENYRRLIEFLDNPKDAKLLRNHVHVEITDSSIDVLYEVPASLRSVVVAVLGYIPRLESFTDGLRLLVARGAASNLDALIADLVIHRQPGQFIGRVKHLVAALPLPEGLPPAQIGKAKRLDRVEEVTRLAKAWRNCLVNYTSQIDRGECAVYLWDDPAGRAACYVRRAGRLGWALHRPLGPRNSELEPEQLALIYNIFAAAGVMEAHAVRAIERILQFD